MGSILTRVYLRIIQFQISNITCRSSNETCSPTIFPWTRISTRIKIQINTALTCEDCTVPSCPLSWTEANKRLFARNRTKRISAHYRILLEILLINHIMINTLAMAILRRIPTISMLRTGWLENTLKLLANQPRKREKPLILKRKKAKWIRLSRVSKVKIKTAKLDSATETIQEWVQDRWDQITRRKFSNSCQYWRKLKKRFNWRRFWSKS